MDDEKDAFYVVRKGDIVGIYRNFTDCQAQVGSSMMNPSVTVYKGYGLGTEAEEHLRSYGIQNSSFSISASEVKEGIFGKLMVCPFQEPSVSTKVKAHDNDLHFQQKKNQDSNSAGTMKADPFSSFLPSPSLKRSRLDGCSKPMPTSSTSNAIKPSSFPKNSSMKQGNLGSVTDSQTMTSSKPYVLEFDGASKGNPGLSGAGAVLRSHDGSVVSSSSVTISCLVLITRQYLSPGFCLQFVMKGLWL